MTTSPSQIDDLLATAKPHWRTGVVVARLPLCAILYERQADDLFIPASLAKVFTTYAAVKLLAKTRGLDLAELLHRMNHFSDNAAAERVIEALGGIPAMQETVRPIAGANPNYLLCDGSGLSRENRISPRHLLGVLEALPRESSSVLSSFAVAGRSGTLLNRFRETPLEGGLRAKTGSLSGVCGLAGWIGSAGVFAITVNSTQDEPSELQAYVYSWALALALTFGLAGPPQVI